MVFACCIACCDVVVCGVWWCVVVCGGIWCVMVCGAWCGVVWCGVVWCGVVWCGVVWCGVVWCGVVWSMMYGVAVGEMFCFVLFCLFAVA
jgi:hypothetical protein